MLFAKCPEVRTPWRLPQCPGAPLPSCSNATQAPERVLAEHYHDLQRKPFYPALISYMTSGPVVAMVRQAWVVERVEGPGLSPELLSPWWSAPLPTSFISVLQVWEGPNVVGSSRAMIGHTDSAEAAPGTIRGDFSIHISRSGRPDTLKPPELMGQLLRVEEGLSQGWLSVPEADPWDLGILLGHSRATRDF